MQGKLLRSDTLNCVENVNTPNERSSNLLPRAKELRVFLFEQIILFSEISGNRRGPYTTPQYNYKAHISVSS